MRATDATPTPPSPRPQPKTRKTVTINDTVSEASIDLVTARYADCDSVESDTKALMADAAAEIR